MKKLSLIVVALLAVFLIFASATGTTPATGRVGYVAPNLSFESEGRQLSLQQFKGQCVVLTLWSTVEPISRLRNKQYATRCDEHEAITHISINLDRSEAVWHATLKADGVSPTLQAHCDVEARKKLEGPWHLDESLDSYLIGPDGIIIAVNPTAEQLAAVEG